MRDRPRIVIAGWAGAANTGDELLTAWAVGAVREAGGEPVVLSVDPADTRRRHGVAAASAGGPGALRALWRADGVLVGPGGILQDASSVWSLPAHATRPLLARLRRLPVAAAGVGAGPVGRRGSRRLLRAMLGTAVDVVVRDEPSAVVLATAGIEAAVAPDPVFSLAAPAAEPDAVVVAVRAGAGPGALRPARVREDDGAHLDAWADAAAQLASALGVAARFLALDARRDPAIHERLAARVGGEAVVVDDTTAPGHLARAEVALCGRYHAAVLALGAGRPVVVVDEGAKLPALVGAFGDGVVSCPRGAEAQAIVEAAEAARGGAPGLAAARVRTAAGAHDRGVVALVEAARRGR